MLCNACEFSDLTECSGPFGALVQLSEGEGLLNQLFGTDCYSQALAQVGNDCKHLDHTKKSRLALMMVNCHLYKLGDRTYACTERMTLKDCTSGMSDRHYNTFNEFFTNIDRCAWSESDFCGANG